MLPTKLGEFLQHLSQTISIHFARNQHTSYTIDSKNVNDSHLFLFRLKNAILFRLKNAIINMSCSILKIKFNQNNNMNSFHWSNVNCSTFVICIAISSPKKCIFIIRYLTYESEWRFFNRGQIRWTAKFIRHRF